MWLWLLFEINSLLLRVLMVSFFGNFSGDVVKCGLLFFFKCVGSGVLFKIFFLL